MGALAFSEWRRPWLMRLIGEARRRQRRRQLTVAGVAAVVVVVAASIYSALAGWGADPSAAGGNSVLAQTPAGSTGFPPPIADALDVADLPASGPVAIADGSLWLNTPDPATVVCSLCATQAASATVSRVDPSSGRLIASIRIGPRGGGALAAGFGSIWALDRTAGTVTRIDPTTNRVTATIATGVLPLAITAGQTGIWIAGSGQGSGASLVEIDPSTERVSARLPLADPAVWLASTAGSVWAADPNRHTILRIDPASAKVSETIPSSSAGPGSQVAVDGSGDLWFGGGGGTRPRLERLDPGTRTITTVLTATLLARDHVQGIDALTYGQGSVWLSGYCGPGSRPYSGESFFCLLQVNPATNQVDLVRALPVGNIGREPERANASIAYDGHTIWFSLYGAWSVQPVNPQLVIVCSRYKRHGAGTFSPDCHAKKP